MGTDGARVSILDRGLDERLVVWESRLGYGAVQTWNRRWVVDKVVIGAMLILLGVWLVVGRVLPLPLVNTVGLILIFALGVVGAVAAFMYTERTLRLVQERYALPDSARKTLTRRELGDTSQFDAWLAHQQRKN